MSSASGSEERPIIWVNELSSGIENQEHGFLDRLFNLIVGSDPIVFVNPVSVLADDPENYWIVSQGNSSILNHRTGKTIKLPVFSKGTGLYPSMVGISSFAGGGFLFTDSKLNGVFSVSADAKQIRAFNDTNSLVRPTGIAYSSVKNEVWVVETGSHRICIYDVNGRRKRTVGERGTGPLEFNFPTYIWIDKDGKIYIVDSMNFRVQILSPEGEFISSFGQQGDASGYFARPRGIATDSRGDIYVVDALANVVQVFDISGNLLYYFGSQGSGKYQFWMPSGIYIDKSDYIYVADSYNGRVQIFQLIKTYLK